MDSDVGVATRWRAFADGVALALGLNLWTQLVLLPSLTTGSLTSGAAAALCAMPLVALTGGVVSRGGHMLLLGYPSLLLVPLAVYPEIAGAHVYGPVRFAIVAASLVGYLFGVSLLAGFREPPVPHRVRPLGSASRPAPARWQRRYRTYRTLTALSLVFPLVLFFTVNFDPETRGFLASRYPGRVTALTALLNLGAIGLWLALYAWFFLGTLAAHRKGDSKLIADLQRLGHDTRTGKTRPQFYLGVGIALALMAALFLLRP